MKILLVHNAYGKLSGEETVIENLAALLSERGVSVCRFSRSSKEIKDKLSRKMAAFFSGIHNPFAAKEFAAFLKSHRPDVVHIHNLYPLISPSILPVCKAFGMPVVMTLHNFRLVCPNGLLLSKGEICHRCLGGREYWCVLRNCENSFFKSTGYALRTAAARWLRRYYDNVDHFICLSEFQKKILVSEGLPADRVCVLANPVWLDVKIPPAHPYEKRELPKEGMTDEWIPVSENVSQSRQMSFRTHVRNLKRSLVALGTWISPFGRNDRKDSRNDRKDSRNDRGDGRNDRGDGRNDRGSGPFGDNSVAGVSVHPPSIPPLKGGKYADDKSMDPRQAHSGMTKGYVAYVGRVSPEKDILTLLEAARRLGDVSFKFAGDYHRMPEVLKNKPMNVEFLGQLNAKEIAEFYRHAQMVVFATRCYEGFPTVLLEAMSHGLPIVCSRIGGLPEIVEDGVNGLLYAPGNVAALTTRIQTLWTDAALCKKLGEEGRKKVREKYDAMLLLDQLLAIYRKVIVAK